MLYFFEIIGLLDFMAGSSDQEKLEENYSKNGLNITESDMLLMLTILTLLSQSTYSSIYNFFVLDKNYIEPFQYTSFIFLIYSST